MRTRIQKWGNSLALRVPKSFAVDAGLENQTPVDVTLRDGNIVITPVVEPRFTLTHLLENITPENMHPEVGTGPRAGREEW